MDGPVMVARAALAANVSTAASHPARVDAGAWTSWLLAGADPDRGLPLCDLAISPVAVRSMKRSRPNSREPRGQLFHCHPVAAVMTMLQVDRERVRRTLTFWLRPAFVPRVVKLAARTPRSGSSTATN